MIFIYLFLIVIIVYLITYWINQGAAPYDKAIKDQPTQGASLENAGWCRVGHRFRPGRLILLDNNLIFRTNDKDVFNFPIKDMKFNYVGAIGTAVAYKDKGHLIKLYRPGFYPIIAVNKLWGVWFENFRNIQTRQSL